MDQTLFATYTAEDLVAYRLRAEALQCGLELHTFISPSVLEHDTTALLETHRQALAGFSGPLGFHGAFFDMVSASIDPGIVALTRRRYLRNLEIASALGGDYLVFHANYMGAFKLCNYRAGWHQRQVAFWRDFMRAAEEYDVVILLENMWADEPDIIGDILDAVDHPMFRACFDVAHATLFSERPPGEWIDALAPYLHCCHLNNHDGQMDRHWPLGTGLVDYVDVLAKIRTLPEPPLLTLELPNLETIEASLGFLDLPVPV